MCLEHRGQRVTAQAGGATLTAIAADLNADSIPTAHGGARWYPSTVRAVLLSQESGVFRGRAARARW